MPSYLLRITLPNQPVKNIFLNRLMAVRAELGAKYMLLDKSGAQLATDLKMSQTGSTLVIEAGGQKMVYLNGYYKPGMGAVFETAQAAVSAAPSSVAAAEVSQTVVESVSSSATSSVATPASSAAVGGSVSSSAGWLSGVSLGGSSGLLLGGAAIVGGAALAAGGKDDEDKTQTGNGTQVPTGPTVSAIALSSTGSADNYLIKDDVVTVTVTMSADTVVTGTPTLKLNIGGTEVNAVYSTGSGSKTLTFTYTIAANQADSDGIAITAGSITLPDGATLRDNSGAHALLSYGAVVAQTQLKVDAVAPVINSFALSSNTTGDTLGAGKTVFIDVTLSEVVKLSQSSDGKWPEVKLMVGSQNVSATFDTSSNNKQVLRFSYTIQAGQNDLDGVSIEADSLFLNGATITDVLGNAAVLSHAAVAAQSTLKVDTTGPVINSFALDSNVEGDTLIAGKMLYVDVQMNELTKFTQSTDGKWPQLKVSIGDQTLLANFDTSSNNNQTLRFSYQVAAGLSDSDGVSIPADALVLNGATVSDAIGNAATTLSNNAVTSNAGFRVDSVLPTASLLNPSPVLLEAIGRTNGLDGGAQLKAIGNSGKFAAIWRGADNVGTDSSNNSVFVQLFNADGSKSGSPVQMNSKVNPQANDFAPELTAIGNDGAFVATWVDYSNNKREIVVQKFDANGNQATPVKFDSFAAGFDLLQDLAPKVAALPDGKFVLTWTSIDTAWNVQSATPPRSIHIQKFNADGSKAGNEIKHKVNGDSSWDYNPEITVVNQTSGAYALAWYGFDTDKDKSVYVQQFSVDGTPSAAIKLEDPLVSNRTDQLPKITALTGSGDFVVTWAGQDSSTGNDFSIFVQRFNAQGKVGDVVALEANGVSDKDDVAPVLTALDNTGKFALSWQGANSSGKNNIFVQVFNADGSIVDADGSSGNNNAIQLYANDGVESTNLTPMIQKISSSGDFVVAWQGSEVDGGTRIYLQRFDISGTKKGSPIILESPFASIDNAVNPSITAIDNAGKFAVSWQGNDLQGDKSVFVQTINADGSLSQAVQSDKNITTGQSINAQSSEAGQLYLVNSQLSTADLLLDVARATPTQSHYWVGKSVAANTSASVSTAGLLPGDYYLYAIDANQNLSAVSSNAVHISAIHDIKITSATNIVSGEYSKNSNSVVTIKASMYGNVDVTGTPSIQLDMGGTPVTAYYTNGTGTNTLTFSYTITENDVDANGIAIVANSLNLHGGKITEAGSSTKEVRNFNFEFVKDNENYLVDNQAPTVRFLHAGTVKSGSDIEVAASEDATLYIVKKDTPVTGVTDFSGTGIADNLWNKVDVLQDEIKTISTAGLINGEYVLYGVDKQGNFSKAASNSSVTLSSVIDTKVVVFDLVNGVSSAHSNRSFDDTTEYTIYVKVNSDNANLGDLSKVDNNSWSAWRGALSLGNDDKVIIVGSGSAVKGNKDQAVDQVVIGSKAVTWQTAGTGHAVKLTYSGQLTRAVPGLTAPVGALLWSSQWQGINNGETLNVIYKTTMPAGLLASQGLV